MTADMEREREFMEKAKVDIDHLMRRVQHVQQIQQAQNANVNANSYTITTGSGSFPAPDGRWTGSGGLYSPCSQGHHIESLQMQQDGFLRGNCISCGALITSTRGESLSERVRWLLEQYITNPSVDTETISTIGLLREALSVELEEISLAMTRLDIIQRDILKTLNGDLDSDVPGSAVDDE